LFVARGECAQVPGHRAGNDGSTTGGRRLLEQLLGDEGAERARTQASRHGWSEDEVVDRLATVGREARAGPARHQATARDQVQYLETWVRLSEAVRRHERLAAFQRRLEAAEAALEAEADATARGQPPADSAVPVAQTLLAGLPADDTATEELRGLCQWGLAYLFLQDELADLPAAAVSWHLRRASHALSSRLAALHFKIFTLEHDNVVLTMHLGALCSRIAHLRADLERAAR
jgi:hypothetical protein